MKCIARITINLFSTSCRTNGSVFDSMSSSGGHINSTIGLMGEWQNEQAIKESHTATQYIYSGNSTGPSHIMSAPSKHLIKYNFPGICNNCIT